LTCRAADRQAQPELTQSWPSKAAPNDRLRRDQRDMIRAYVARNLPRPLAYSAAGRDKPGSGSWGLGDPAAAGLALLRRAHAEASRYPEELTRLH
jgi:hypothetical protein